MNLCNSSNTAAADFAVVCCSLVLCSDIKSSDAGPLPSSSFLLKKRLKSSLDPRPPPLFRAVSRVAILRNRIALPSPGFACYIGHRSQHILLFSLSAVDDAPTLHSPQPRRRPKTPSVLRTVAPLAPTTRNLTTRRLDSTIARDARTAASQGQNLFLFAPPHLPRVSLSRAG